MATQHESCQDEEQGSSHSVNTDALGDIFIHQQKRTWKQAFNNKAMLISWNLAPGEITTGYKIMWYLWSADIWFGRFPLLKFIVGVNVAVWVMLFLTT